MGGKNSYYVWIAVLDIVLPPIVKSVTHDPRPCIQFNNVYFLSLGCYTPIFKEAYYDGPVERVQPGHKLMLRCKTAYKEARPLVTCQEGNKWSELQPKCERKL